MVSKHGLHTDPKKIEDVQKFLEPSDQTGVQRFLGMASYCCHYINQFATIAPPLHSLLKTDNFHWTSACQTAFDALKQKLLSAPVLTFPDFTKAFYLQCDTSTETAATAIVKNVLLKFSMLHTILTDRGANLTSELIQNICKLCGIDKRQTTTWNPRCDGLTECQNAMLAAIMSHYVATNARDWDRFLPFATFCINTSTQEGTKESAFFLVYRRDPVLQLEIAFKPPNTKYLDTTTYVIQLQQNLHNAWMLSKEHIVAVQECQKFHYDRNAFLPCLYLGQCVLHHISALPSSRCKKFAFRWYRPFHILELHGVNMIIRPCHKPHQSPETVHINKLKPVLFPRHA